MLKFSTIDHTGAMRLHQPTSVRKVDLTGGVTVWAIRNPKNTKDVFYYLDLSCKLVYEVYEKGTQYDVGAHPVGRLIQAPTEAY